MAISFGTPGRPRKSIRDNKFELVQSNGAHRTPAKLARTVTAAEVIDGRFVAMDAQGDYIAAADAKRSIRMIFTGDTQRMNHAYEPRDAADPTQYERPGVDPSDTVTGWMGEIEGIWPAALIDLGALLSVNDIVQHAPLTVRNGRIAVADEVAGDPVIGRVVATAAILGSPAIQAAIHVR